MNSGPGKKGKGTVLSKLKKQSAPLAQNWTPHAVSDHGEKDGQSKSEAAAPPTVGTKQGSRLSWRNLYMKSVNGRRGAAGKKSPRGERGPYPTHSSLNRLIWGTERVGQQREGTAKQPEVCSASSSGRPHFAGTKCGPIFLGHENQERRENQGPASGEKKKNTSWGVAEDKKAVTTKYLSGPRATSTQLGKGAVLSPERKKSSFRNITRRKTTCAWALESTK